MCREMEAGMGLGMGMGMGMEMEVENKTHLAGYIHSYMITRDVKHNLYHHVVVG